MASFGAAIPYLVLAALAVIVLVTGGLLAMVLGFLLFAAGFLALCGRYGAAERRASELEGLVQELQQRMEQ